MKTSLWPRLRFTVTELDYQAVRVDAAWLRHMGERLQAGEQMAPVQWAIGTCLLRLADTPAALNALNRHAPRAPASLRALNIAVHYLVRCELRGKRQSKLARYDVAVAWSVADATVKDAMNSEGRNARRALRDLLRLCLSRPSPKSERAILQMIDRDMRDRAQQEWAKTRQRRTR